MKPEDVLALKEIKEALLNAHTDANVRELTKKSIKRLVTGAMSFGSLSEEAHTTIAKGVNFLALAVNDKENVDDLAPEDGPKSNSGEGGEYSDRNKGKKDHEARSRIRQIASSHFGVTAEYYANADILQLKASQSAKPGDGGTLPGDKNSAAIAKARHVPQGVTLDSPANLHNLYSIEELTQNRNNFHAANPKATASLKLTSMQGIEIVAYGGAKARFENLLIAGPGGTGASTHSAQYELALPVEIGVARSYQLLVASGWKDITTITASGGIHTAEQWFILTALGASFIEVGTKILIEALGCIMERDCHTNKCPKGIATTDQALIDASFEGTPVRVARSLINFATSFALLLQQYGLTDPKDLIGRTDLLLCQLGDSPAQDLNNTPDQNNWLDSIKELLRKPVNATAQFNLESLPPLPEPSWEEMAVIEGIKKGQREFVFEGRDGISAFGARLHYTMQTDPSFPNIQENPVTVTFNGAVGQAFGLVAPAGLTLIANRANDSAGESLDGATIIIKEAFGGVACYGATSGTFMGPLGSDRADIRNSGADFFTEEVGDCLGNFKTGGNTVVFGAPSDYEGLLCPDYTSPSLPYEGLSDPNTKATFNDKMGPNIGSGFTAGHLFLPKKLYQSQKEQAYFAKEALAMEKKAPADSDPLKLNDKDIRKLRKFITDYAQGTGRTWVLELLKDDHFERHFVKLDPNPPKRSKQYVATPESKVAAATEPAPGPHTNATQATQATQATPDGDKPGPAYEVQIHERRRTKPTAAEAKASFIPISDPNTTSKNALDASSASAQAFASEVSQGASVSLPANPTELIDTPPKTPPEQPRDENPAEKDACGTALFVAKDGQASRETVETVLSLLPKFQHRGATGIDPETGDGCGVVFYGLDEFFQAEFPNLGLSKGNYSVIPLALPPDEAEDAREEALTLFTALLAKENLSIAGARAVATDKSLLGPIAKSLDLPVTQYVVLKPAELTQSEFEKKLTLIRLRFEFTMQSKQSKNPEAYRPHIISASSYGVTYQSLVREDRYSHFFKDFGHQNFKASAGIAHTRYSTNTFAVLKNIQPCATVLANNGENNALKKLVVYLKNSPEFQALIGLDIDLKGLSDSHIMAIYLAYLYLLGYSIEQIVASTIHPYAPQGDASSTFYNLFAIPFEGPNASIIAIEDRIAIAKDTFGLRPLRVVVNEQYIYAGSEYLNLPQMTGKSQISKLPAGRALTIDLKTGCIAPLETPVATRAVYEQQLQQLQSFPSELPPTEDDLPWPDEKLKVRQLQVGWNDEFHHLVMRSLYKHITNLRSMGDHSAVEFTLVNLQYFANFLKALFAQVTNPAISKQEFCYFSTLTYLGPHRPSLTELLNPLTPLKGYLTHNSIISNEQLALMKRADFFKPETIAINIDCRLGTPTRETVYATIEQIKKACLSAIKERQVSLLILSDKECPPGYMPLPGMLACSIIENELTKQGLRSSVCLVLQSSSLLAERDFAQGYSLGGADALHPYLSYMNKSPQQIEHYRAATLEGVKNFMRRLGIATLSSYRGSKQFTALGVSGELADLLGITAVLDGLSIEGLMEMCYQTWHFPLAPDQGLGKYGTSKSNNRTPIWTKTLVSTAINSTKTDSPLEARRLVQAMEAEAKKQDSGFPRGALKLVPPTHYCNNYPLRIALIGGGAAAFYLTRYLLDSGMPVEITMFEQAPVNRIGLVGQGIAPDHSTKQTQIALHKEILTNERVRYCGGVTITDTPIPGAITVSVTTLKNAFSCVIDCSGAQSDKRLGKDNQALPGEHSEIGVLPASFVYPTYNDSFHTKQTYPAWPFNTGSKHPTIAIIGMGNVAADLARLLLTDPKQLAKEARSINPEYLKALQTQAPNIVQIIGRSSAAACKIGKEELRELQDLEDAGQLVITASFEDLAPEELKSKEDPDYEHQQAVLAFLLRHRNKAYTPGTHGAKKLEFIFGMKPEKFEKKSRFVLASFTNKQGERVEYQARNFIVSAGKTATPIEGCDYQAGWVTGTGGTLTLTKESALQVAEQIQADFMSHKFTYFSPEESISELEVPVSNQQALNILTFYLDGFRINSREDYERARCYHANTHTGAAHGRVSPALTLTEGQVTVYTAHQHPKPLLIEQEDAQKSLMQVITDQGLAMGHSCSGKGNCGECVVTIEGLHELPRASSEEAAIIKGVLGNVGLFGQHPGGQNWARRLSCEVAATGVEGASAVNIAKPKERRPLPAVQEPTASAFNLGAV